MNEAKVRLLETKQQLDDAVMAALHDNSHTFGQRIDYERDEGNEAFAKRLEFELEMTNGHIEARYLEGRR